MNKKARGKSPIDPRIGCVILLVLLAAAYFAAAVGSVAPINFIYDGI
jgi:hypothetical protein